MKTHRRHLIIVLVGLLLGLLGVWEPWCQDELWSSARTPSAANFRRAAIEVARGPKRTTHPETDPALLPLVTPARDNVRV